MIKHYNSLLKVPEGLVEKSNKLGVLSEVLFYYQLKSLNKQGHFREASEIIEQTKLSKSFVYSKLTSLSNLGLVKKTFNGYTLCSYETLWDKLGYDLSIERGKQEYRKGKFYIHKIYYSKIFYFKIVQQEIKLNLNKQKRAYKIKKRILIKNLIQKSTKKGCKMTKVQALATIIKIEEYSFRLFFSLASTGLARILGLSSPSQGYRTAQKLKQLHLINYSYSIENPYALISIP